MTSHPPKSNMADFSPLSTNPHPNMATFYPLSTNPEPRIKTRPLSPHQLVLLLIYSELFVPIYSDLCLK